jgi:16S rRNA pseudouridine516 synthase
MGPLKLDENLKPGEYRKLTVSEVEALLNNKPRNN